MDGRSEQGHPFQERLPNGDAVPPVRVLSAIGYYIYSYEDNLAAVAPAGSGLVPDPWRGESPVRTVCQPA